MGVLLIAVVTSLTGSAYREEDLFGLTFLEGLVCDYLAMPIWVNIVAVGTCGGKETFTSWLTRELRKRDSGSN